MIAWRRGLVKLVLLLGVILAPSGCADFSFDNVPALPSKAEEPALYRAVPVASFTISPGDKLTIASYYHPDLKQGVTVQPDGRVSLLLLGSLTAAGKTPGEFSKELARSYNKYVENSEITVNIEDSAALTVYVGGEVAHPSLLPLKGELSLLQSITEAGGFLSTSNKEQVLIVRQTANAGFRTLQANADQVLHNQADELYLRPHDIVYVPKSTIARVDQFVDQYLGQVVPRWVVSSFGFSYLLNGGSASSPTIISPTAR